MSGSIIAAAPRITISDALNRFCRENPLLVTNKANYRDLAVEKGLRLALTYSRGVLTVSVKYSSEWKVPSDCFLWAHLTQVANGGLAERPYCSARVVSYAADDLGCISVRMSLPKRNTYALSFSLKEKPSFKTDD